MASTSSDEEVDELATSPAPTPIPDVADSSDEEQDTTVRQPVQRRRPLTADERVLAKAVQAGVAAEELTLIKGVRLVLQNHKAAHLEAQGIQDLEDYVANETRQDPARKALLVHTKFSAWRRNQGLPVVPISEATIYRYAHQVFVDANANWRHEHRLSMLRLLEQLRAVANKGYEKARALETVDRDLDAESDNSDSQTEDDLDYISSGEEAAQKLAASSPGHLSRGASEAITNQMQKAVNKEATVKEINGSKRSGSRSESPHRSKRQKQQATPLRAPSPVTAQNVTTITNDALSYAMGPRRSHSKSLSGSLPLLSPRSSRLGQPVQPTRPSIWTNSPASGVQPHADALAATPQNLQQSSGRIVIDLSMDSSDEDDSSTPPVNTTKHTEAKDPDVSNNNAELSSTATRISAEPVKTVQPSIAKKPRPPLFPRPRPQNIENAEETSELSASHTPTTATVIKKHSEDLEAVSVVNDAAKDDPLQSANGSTSTPVEPSIPAIAHPAAAATFFNKAVRAIKETIAAAVTKSSAPASPSAESIAESEVVSHKEDNHERPRQTADAPVPAADVVMEGSTIVSTEPDKAVSTQRTGMAEKESEQAQVAEGILTTLSSMEEAQASNLVPPNSTSRAEDSVNKVPAVSRTETSIQDPDSTLELPAAKVCEATENSVKPVDSLGAPAPSLSGAASSTDGYLDRWDKIFHKLERAILISLDNADHASMTQRTQRTQTSLYLKGTVVNRQVSVSFGEQRNARRKERLQHLRQAQLAQLRSHHALQNYLGPVPAIATTRNTQPRPTTAVEVGAGTTLPNTDASTQDAVWAHVPTNPVRQTDPSQQALTLSQWQSMSLAQQKATRSAMLQRLKPRYPDFLRDIRNPTLATGLGPVYLGGATPSEILGGTARDHRRVSNPSQPAGVSAGPSVGQSDVQNGQQPSLACSSAAVVGSTQSVQISTTSSINTIARSVQQSSEQVQSPMLQDNVSISKPPLDPTQDIVTSTASATPTVTANASSITRTYEAMHGVPAAGQPSEQAHPPEVGPPESRFTEITSPAIASIPIQPAPSLGELSLFQSSRASVGGADGAIQPSSVVMQAPASALSSTNESVVVKRATIEGSERSMSASASGSNHEHRRSSAQAALGHGLRQPSLAMQSDGTFQSSAVSHNGLQHRHFSGPLPERRSSSNSPTTVMVPPERRRHSGYEPNGKALNDVRISSRPGSNHSSPLVKGHKGFAFQQQTQTPGRQGSPGYMYEGQGNRYILPGGGPPQAPPPLAGTQTPPATDLRQPPTAQRPPTRQIWAPQQDGSLRYMPGYSQAGYQQAQQFIQPYQPAYFPPSVLHGTPAYQHPHLHHYQQPQQLPPQNYQSYQFSQPQQQQQSTWSSGSTQSNQKQHFPSQQPLHAQNSHQSNAPQMMPQYQYASIPYYTSSGQPPINSGALKQGQPHVPDSTLNRQHVQHAVQQSQAQEQRAQHVLGQSLSYPTQQPQASMQQQTKMQPSAHSPQQQQQLQHQASTATSTSTVSTTVNAGQTTIRPSSRSLNTASNGNNPSTSLDKLLARQEILEEIASKSAETLDLNHIASQCETLKRADLSDADIDYFRRRAIVLMDQLRKKKAIA